MTIRSIFRVLSLLVLAPVASLHAQVVVVSWGPATDIVTTNTNLTFNKDSVVVNFSQFSSPTSVNYYPNDAGKTPDFYGASKGFNQDGDFNVTWRINENASGDSIWSSISNSGATQTDVHQIAIWTIDEFINAGSATEVSLVSMAAVKQQNTGNHVTRFVVRLGATDFYVSEIVTGNSPSLPDPTTVDWFSYDPTTNFTSIGALASLAPADFQTMTAAGVYLHNSVGGAFNQSRLMSFEVMAVPEPGTYALLLGVLGLGLVLVRRRR